MREDEIHREIASRVSGVTPNLPTSAIGLPARLIAGLTRAGTASLGRALRRRVGRRREPDLAAEAAVVSSLGRLKGVAMKMGQLFGYIDVGLPANLRSALSVLHTRAQPLALDRIRAVVEGDFGAAGRALAAAMQPEPIAVGSLGQVHRSVLPDGTPVAVKVAYPGIAATVSRDFAPAALTGRVASWVYPRAHFDSFVREVCARILEECDYSLEAARQERFAALFAGHPTIVVPAVHRALSSSCVLTTSFVDGVHLAEYLLSEPTGAARQRAGEALFDFYVGTLFQHGLYNCDPHPGNFLFTPDGRLAIVDFGSVREFPPGFVERLAALTHALGVDDRDLVHRALVDLGIAGGGGDDDQEATRSLLRAFYGPLLRDEVTSFDPRSGIALREVVRRSRRARGLALPAELVFLVRTSLGLSSVLGRLGARENWYRRLQTLLATPSAAAVAATPAATMPTPTLVEPLAIPDEAAPAREPTTPARERATPVPYDVGSAVYDLVLIAPGRNPIALLRVLRELTGLQLRDAKHLMDTSPQILKQSVPSDEARALRRRLETAGARVELRPISPRRPRTN